MRKTKLYLNLVLSCALCLMSIVGSAQAPPLTNYQSVLRDASGNIMPNQNLCVQSTITNGSGGTILYREEFTPTTNQFGLFSVALGGGVADIGTYATIDWANVNPWQKVEVKINCTGSYITMGNAQLLTVPYAFNAAKATTSADNHWAGTGNNIYNTNSGNVGIGTSTPFYNLDVTGNTGRTGSFVNTATSIDNNGIYGSCNNTPYYGVGVSGVGGYKGVSGIANIPGTGNRFGVTGFGSLGTGSNYGVHGTATGGTTAYGLYGDATGATTNYAGYFNSGYVYVKNRLGIGDILNQLPQYPLDVRSNSAPWTANFYNSMDFSGATAILATSDNIGTGERIGITAAGRNGSSGNNTGIYAEGMGGTGGWASYGVHAVASNGTDAYGILASASGATKNYAGYFASGNVYVANSLGIGNINNQMPSYPLDVKTNSNFIAGHFYNSSGFSPITAIDATADNVGSGERIGISAAGRNGSSGNNTGIYAEGVGGAGGWASYGVHAVASNGTDAYGILASASGASTANWAGYFIGSVYTTGTYQSSDRKLKNDIKPLSGAMAIIEQLKPSSYTFKTSEYQQMNLPEGLQYGLIADEVQQVMPGAVKKAVQPADYENHDSGKGKKLNDEVEFNAVNYTEFIPVLIGAVKEQQATIFDLQTTLKHEQLLNAQLLKRVEVLEKK